MKIGCGTDIIEVQRIKESIENFGDKFLNKIYTQKEIEYCTQKSEIKYERFAARFAAKEAVYKAISNKSISRQNITWQNIEIINNKQGKPFVNFLNTSFDEIQEIDISLSHIKEYAIANCICIFN